MRDARIFESVETRVEDFIGFGACPSGANRIAAYGNQIGPQPLKKLDQYGNFDTWYASTIGFLVTLSIKSSLSKETRTA